VAAACCSFSSVRNRRPSVPELERSRFFKEADLKPGMKGYAWTVLKGSEPEPLPVEILGIYKNQWGPKQDVIMAKLGGKGQRTQRGSRHERQSRIYRRKAGRSHRAALQHLLARRAVRDHGPLS